MTHVAEDQLIAFVLDDVEPAERETVQAHLEQCEACRAEAAALRATLEAASAQPVPERGDDYGADVWARLEPKLNDARVATTRSTAWRGWLAVAAVLVAVAGAFLAGRLSRETAPTAAVARAAPSDAGAIRERVVLAALGDHLDRTERTLTEIVNASDGDRVDISAEQAWARDLLDANRLYRQSARGATSRVALAGARRARTGAARHRPQPQRAVGRRIPDASIAHRGSKPRVQAAGDWRGRSRPPEDPASSRREDVMIASFLAALLTVGSPSAPPVPTALPVAVADEAQDTETALYQAGTASIDRGDWRTRSRPSRKSSRSRASAPTRRSTGAPTPATRCRCAKTR